jgi:hypothetical protein
MTMHHHGDTVIIFPSRQQYNAVDLLHGVRDSALEHGLVLVGIVEEVSDTVVMEAVNKGLHLLVLGDVLNGAIIVEGELELTDDARSAPPVWTMGSFNEWASRVAAIVVKHEEGRGGTKEVDEDNDEESEVSGEGEQQGESGRGHAGDGLGDGGTLADVDLDDTDGNDLGGLGVNPSGDGSGGVRGDPESRMHRDD